MPNWTQGDAAAPGDDELRSLAKYVQLLYDANGAKPSPFPEGLEPKPGDNIMRLEQKAVILRGS